MREAVGGRVVAARRRIGLTQVQLAQAVGVDGQTISKIERGLQTPTGTTLRGLSEVLRVSSSHLLGEGDGWGEVRASKATAPADLTQQGRRMIEEYLGSTHGRSAPKDVKARLREGQVFTSLGVTSPGWRDVEDLRNILERQSSQGAASPSALTARDGARKLGNSYRRGRTAQEDDASLAVEPLPRSAARKTKRPRKRRDG
ncbi:MAG: helix-turn-helix transcriptional regulator [Myxococcales bacterium]